MARITEPAAAFSASFIATAKVAPLEMPQKMPSFAASARAHLMPSGPGIATRSSKYFLSIASCSTNGTKSGVQPWIGCGSKAGWLHAGAPSAVRSCTLPLPISWALAGSHSTIRVSGRSLRSTRPTPDSVPPVP